MEFGDRRTTSSSSPTQSPTPPSLIMSPCAACKILRRRCVDNCVLAPYFPPTDPLSFTIAHKVFGAGNIIKLLQEIPDSQRADTVRSIVYEANARIRDPVYGCAGVIYQLQKQVTEIGAELAKTQAQLVNMQCQQANLLGLVCMDMPQSQQQQQQQHEEYKIGMELEEDYRGPCWVVADTLGNGAVAGVLAAQFCGVLAAQFCAATELVLGYRVLHQVMLIRPSAGVCLFCSVSHFRLAAVCFALLSFVQFFSFLEFGCLIGFSPILGLVQEAL
ncbi:hypothetical protein ACSBR2_026720 [Camellia fascicularis]